MQKPFFQIDYYHDYLTPEFASELLHQAKPVEAVSGLVQIGERGGLETDEALEFLCALYQEVAPELNRVLQQRRADRKFLDERVKACYEFNKSLGREITDADYKTVIGLEDAKGRIVIGPKSEKYCLPDASRPVADIPEYLQGIHVTLFGPPDSAKMSVNAMNAYHRKLKDEPSIVEELLRNNKTVPFWGADDEDSKTPLRQDLIDAGVNLTACFDGNIRVEEASGKTYELAQDHLSLPIKRFPGLALPCSFLFLDRSPIPLHLYDFALHFYRNYKNQKALTFYVPKLENEEEAAYTRLMIQTAEQMIHKKDPSYKLGSVRLMIVLENPRAILRAHEIMDNLYPYFVGASLGWHDYLGSTARLFKEDGNYRIPVKADPNIVIKYIKASHNLLADVVGSRKGIKVGGMYGILPQTTDLKSDSFQITIKGFIKDVLTQLKRDLTGFWVAHPDFVRLGIAFVKAWEFHKAGDSSKLISLIQSLLQPKYHKEIQDFISSPDIEGLDKGDPNYVRSLLVADIKESDYIANNHPDEIRYNVFQSLQYLTDWLSGNGCVALPAIIQDTPVRVMDDLATAERSRWEVWHEIKHGRFSVQDFLTIAQEELHFIRKDRSNDKKIVQVKWDERTAKWYPVAFQIMLKLITDEKPAEFATELLMPFTIDSIRSSADPIQALRKMDSSALKLREDVQSFVDIFDVCGCKRFATELSKISVCTSMQARDLIMSFSKAEIIEAASFHGDIGEGKKTLDHFATQEQALVFNSEEGVRQQLKDLGADYLKKFGVKFLVSAKGKTANELLSILKQRIQNSAEQELQNAREALWLISEKRLVEKPLDRISEEIEVLKKKYKVSDVSLALLNGNEIQALQNTTDYFQLASLSKTIASAFALTYFADKKIPLTSSVNALLRQYGSDFQITAEGAENSAWAEQVSIENLISHSALNMHYVNGGSLSSPMPNVKELIFGNEKHNYKVVQVIHPPGRVFSYSGGGFLVLEHLIEQMEGQSIQNLTKDFLLKMAGGQISFDQKLSDGNPHAKGSFDDLSLVPEGRLMFPAFAAGASGTAAGMAQVLAQLAKAYSSLQSDSKISHDVAVRMLHGLDKGCREFMGCRMGLGVFVAEAGANKLMLHQGANEGFRALFVHCFDGPDYGKGFVVLCNADNRGVLFISELAQKLLANMNFTGIDFEKFKANLDFSGISQEQIVNQGYKKLIFEAFQECLPEEIVEKGPRLTTADFNLLKEAQIQFVTNQRFARAENLISDFEPVFDPELFGTQGKIMDSWESARHNPDECDHIVFRLKSASQVSCLDLSTKFHDGNQAEFVRVLYATAEQVEKSLAKIEWAELLPKTQMLGHAYRRIKLAEPVQDVALVKVEMYPDGGLSRLALYQNFADVAGLVSLGMRAGPEAIFAKLEKSECHRFTEAIPKTLKSLSISYQPSAEEIQKNIQRAQAMGQAINLASLAFGAKMIRATNEHYGPAIQLLSPYPAINMFDGIESARSRKVGHSEHVEVQLAEPKKISKVLLDFKYFVNNNPMFITLEGKSKGSDWKHLVPKLSVKAFAGLAMEVAFENDEVIEQIRLTTLPDGGINRIGIY